MQRKKSNINSMNGLKAANEDIHDNSHYDDDVDDDDEKLSSGGRIKIEFSKFILKITNALNINPKENRMRFIYVRM